VTGGAVSFLTPMTLDPANSAPACSHPWGHRFQALPQRGGGWTGARPALAYTRFSPGFHKNLLILNNVDIHKGIFNISLFFYRSLVRIAELHEANHESLPPENCITYPPNFFLCVFFKKLPW